MPDERWVLPDVESQAQYRADLAVLLLFSAAPSDRALAGWLSPFACMTEVERSRYGWSLALACGDDDSDVPEVPF